MEKCDTCGVEGTKNDINFGMCWDCARAIEVIGGGIDLEGARDFSETSPQEKLKFLIEVGGMYIEVEEDAE